MAEQKKVLFADDDKDDGLKVNRNYAKSFELRKQREELKTHDEEEDESSSEDEDQDAELLTTKLDLDITRTINALRTKDAKIYDPNARFFEEDDSGEEEESDENDGRKKPKPKFYKDVVREQVLEQMENGDAVTELDDEDDQDSPNNTSQLAYDAQQEEIRRAFLESTKDDEQGDDDIVVPKKKSRTENQREKQLLIQELEKLKETATDQDKLIDPKGEIEDGQAFLLDFFKNRPWMEEGDDVDDESDDNEEEFDAESKLRQKAGDDDDSDDDASLEDLDNADDFEAQYNFRFEQAAAGTASGATHSLQTYSRSMDTSLRRKDVSRREKRLARKERKLQERRAKEEQLKRLKNAKKQELEEKLQKIKGVIGQGEGRGEVVDEAAILKLLEGDFDPDKYEELMKATYNDEFYQKEDREWKTDTDVRESLRKDEDGDLLVGDGAEGGLYDDQEEYDETGDGEAYAEEEEWPEEEWKEEEDQPPEESEIEKKVRAKMEDELYKLDYEDIVAGMPTRFKYRQVEPNSYGLTTEEILFARDSTLKQFVSLKKLAPYAEREYHVVSKKRRRFREMLKHDLEEELREQSEENEPKNKKRRRLRKGSKKRSSEAEAESRETNAEPKGNDESKETDVDPKKETDVGPKTKPGHEKDEQPLTSAKSNDGGQKKNKSPKEAKQQRKKKKKRKKKVEGVSESRLASYGL